MFKFFFNWKNVPTVIAGVIGYIIGISLLGRVFSLIEIIIFVIVMFILYENKRLYNRSVKYD